MKKLLLLLAPLLLVGGGCIDVNVQNYYTNPTSTEPVVVVQPKETSIVYYVSKDLSTKYCNGADMDSTGFKKSLTNIMTAAVPGTLSLLDTVKMTLTKAQAASDFKDSNYTQIDKIMIINGVVILYLVGGWVGFSIFMCAW